MKIILGILFIILLVQIIMNQQEIDYHIIESQRKNGDFKEKDMIQNRGIINRFIFGIRVGYNEVKDQK